MRAYNLAMAQIFFSCAFAILNGIKIGMTNVSIFGIDYGNHTGAYGALAGLANPIFTIEGFEVTGIIVFAGILATATVVVLSTNLINAQGIAYTAFAVIFWGAFVSAVSVFTGFDIAGLEIFLVIYTIASTLIFFIALVQMPTGGQKAHV